MKQRLNPKIMPKVSLITPNWNGGKEPLEFIESVKNLNYPPEKKEIIIVDNGSQDNSPQLIAKKYPHVKLIRLKNNIGYGPALNKGINQAEGQYIFIGNNDLILEKNSLFHLVNYLIDHPETGIVGGKVFFKSNRQKIASCGQRYNFWTGQITNCPNPDQKKEVDWVQGCAYLFAFKLIKKIGAYDRDFAKIYFEDFDLCLRAKKAGFNIIYLPQAIFYHGQSTTMEKNQPFKLYQWYKNKLRFNIIYANTFQLISSLLIQLITLIPYHLLILKDKSLVPFCQAVLWNLKNFKQTMRVRKNAKN